MNLSLLAWVHRGIMVWAVCYAFYTGAVSGYYEKTAYERGVTAGEMATTARYITRLSMNELSNERI